ncbi:cysteine/1-D-myo-inosityl 2-amino-2-deoxy-alpha-D-glucopyranoside ligase [Beutenbergia cavernae DSM 12333]|uniref:L-cysteine:1D-myo-inositol 2-amino-2-deoxy-alpha-D-glucopyranoside ligase n=1 Tax=Beutenbergia cavernae (strain ATCC BAA-8 / DSM 12333 / CCUG 43141 / JCM 11478 / NBRC 16432 / NCIMB 13614 / HKI 0122) TaxID=471853 RepID=MSHC_BEUC1|nr:cysteine--1-D-myo-inosityl 2-amino-2-deoxy-alpha-D-glucopyranoside ligase [Beutenbergia cavernae]C5BVB1.1 RecName: Full=L-cysteine:1D-myo-inositol 2-amino-2-deoxy-alpha-D-glucopyranoside ligase; Short=L-Cys:GlcN-Ins ligase; AltName: Full=Mycothiol ligase; Short=MSH ligase [Beutenbergia cavernae DSM 12333]ACQ80498.1 cysteine/1-D-myo-inosityl 2-amino-2-deoxy-alpha-D-glucopyranoside ligase [Beutenbergia cavernae DSM 12333]
MLAWSSPDVPSLDDPGECPREVRVRDTATGELTPAGHDGRASMYVCGITPYDSTHLGHANTYVSFDLLVRAWRDAGLAVTYVQNVTDVDDPLLERAAATGVDWRQLAADQIELFHHDMVALRVVAPEHYIGAVESVPDVVRAVERMLADRAAYRVGAAADGAGDGDVYAALSADPRFGSLGSLDEAEMLELFGERGGDPDRLGKQAPLDPLLWRVEREEEPSWPGESLGRGRPGWHIECATIAARFLGVPFDVQGGGTDLEFPHHEMSESHLRVLTATAHPARAHVHGGMVAYQGHKMSKSRGNLVFVSELVASGVDPMAVRLVILAHHYAEDWEYEAGALGLAEERLATWRAALAQGSGPSGADVVAGVRAALANDLDAPGAVAVVDDWAAAAIAGSGDDAAAGATVARAVDALLGVAL